MRKKSRAREVTCIICDKVFFTNHSRGKYCSPDCRKKGHRASWNKYSKNNRDKRRAYYKKHYSENREKIIEKTSIYAKTEAGKKAQRKADIKQKNLYPEKYQARQKVRIAVRGGHLKKLNCEKCGENKTEAHHEDYSKPLDVIWLCKKCHTKLHY